MNDLNGKLVLVIGATSGIGRVTAIAAAATGAHVICAGRRADHGAAVVAEIRATNGRADFVRADIADTASVAALFDAIDARHGPLHGAVNVAALEAPPFAFPDIPLDLFDELQATNSRGTFMCLQHELRRMRTHGRGAVVNIASLAGITGIGQMGAYVASKHAVVGMTRAAAIDAAAFGVRVNAICPGAIRTEMMQRWLDSSDQAERLLAGKAPMNRIGDSAEVANAAIWLLSGAASYVTGLIMQVDGGVSTGVMM